MISGRQLVASLIIPSELGALANVRGFIEAFCSDSKIDAQTTASVVLAVHEAVANVVRHSHGFRADLPIHVSCSQNLDSLEIFVEDRGPPFDIAAVPTIDPRQIREGGRGVYLMRRLMDEVETVPRAEGGNILRMVKRWQAIS